MDSIYDQHAKAFAGVSAYAAWSATRKLPEGHPLRDVIKDQGQPWDRDLQNAGFTVLQAV